MRNKLWQDIWVRKGIVDQDRPLHVINGYDLLTEAAWNEMVAKVTAPLGIRATDKVLEFGCGAGAFLNTLQALTPGLSVAGVDYTDSLIQIARQRLQGQFVTHDITARLTIPDNRFEVTASFSVINYLDGLEAAESVVSEMVRVSNDRIYIGDVNDIEKQSLAESIRAVSHVNAKRLSDLSIDQQYFPKSFFVLLAEKMRTSCTIVDHTEFGLGDYEAAQYRYSVYLRKSAPQPLSQ